MINLLEMFQEEKAALKKSDEEDPRLVEAKGEDILHANANWESNEMKDANELRTGIKESFSFQILSSNILWF